MGVVVDQIRKAERRAAALGVDLAELVRSTSGKTPEQLDSAAQRDARLSFLRESLGDETIADTVFERVIGGNELQDVNFLERGAIASRAVSLVKIRGAGGGHLGSGTGFLIAPGALITNHHVLPDADVAARSEVVFSYERRIDGRLGEPTTFALEPGTFFFSDAALDFSIVAVRGDTSPFGFIPLVERIGKVSEGEWLTIVQHPRGEPKQVCVRENRLIKRADDVLWYSTDTLGGSSGSPVFNNDWFVVALHHSGVPAKDEAGRVLTIDGRPFDPSTDDDDSRIKWIANEGIRVSRIVGRLRAARGGHSFVAPILSQDARSARIPDIVAPAPISPNPRQIEKGVQPMPQSQPAIRRVAITLLIDESGAVTLDGGTAPSHAESTFVAEATNASRRGREPKLRTLFDSDYSKRKGYDPGFLGKGDLTVNLPTLSVALKRDVAYRLDATDECVLPYTNYSVVMHARRRLAVYSAANVRFDMRYDLSGRQDKWYEDPRIAADHQIGDFYYKDNKFDRGHLTRREDMEYGEDRGAAVRAANDTCHFTNCAPQHARFNQNRDTWQGIERYILEDRIKKEELSVQVITGPVFEEDDPVYDRFPKIQYPVRYWKVVATKASEAPNAGLFATAYLLDQSEAIAKYGLEADLPFAAFKTYQTPISEIERLTGLSFTYGKNKSLRDVDPLETKPVRRQHRRSELEADGVDAPSGYVALADLDDIYTG